MHVITYTWFIYMYIYIYRENEWDASGIKSLVCPLTGKGKPGVYQVYHDEWGYTLKLIVL